MDKEDAMKCYSATKKKETQTLLRRWVNLEGIILSEISQIEKDKYCLISLIYGMYESWTNRSRVDWWLPQAGGEWVQVVKGYNLPVIHWMSSGYIIYSMMTADNNTILYTWKSLRESILKVLTTPSPNTYNYVRWRIC